MKIDTIFVFLNRKKINARMYVNTVTALNTVMFR